MAKHHPKRVTPPTALERTEAAAASPALRALAAVTTWAGGGRLVGAGGQLLPEQVEELAALLAPTESHFVAAGAEPERETAAAMRWAVVAGLVDVHGVVIQASDAGRRLIDEPLPAWEAAFSSLLGRGILTTQLGRPTPWAVAVDRAVLPLLGYLFGARSARPPEEVLTMMCQAVAEEASDDPDLRFILDQEDWIEGAALAGSEVMWWLADLGTVTLRPTCQLTPLGRWAVEIVLRTSGALTE
jgi:hypothetical protein